MLLALLLIPFGISAGALEVTKNGLFIPKKLGDVKVFHENDNFYIGSHGTYEKVQRYNLDKELREMRQDQLIKFLGAGYLAINQSDNGEYSIKAKVRGLGGGPVTASVLYWLTKSVCYGGAAVAVGTATVATGGAVATALGGGAVVTAATGGAVAATGVVVSGTAAGAAMGTGGAVVAAGAIATSAAATEVVTMATVSTMVTSGGCVAAAMAQVETAAIGAAAFGLWLPLP